jgi:hypothetical protein
VALTEAADVGRVDVFDRSLVDDAGGDMPGGDEIAEPLRGIGMVLVVVGGAGHSHNP